MYSTHVGITWSLFVYHNLWLSLVRYIHNSFVLRLLSLPTIQFSIFHVILDPLNQFVVYLNNKPSSLPSLPSAVTALCVSLPLSLRPCQALRGPSSLPRPPFLHWRGLLSGSCHHHSTELLTLLSAGQTQIALVFSYTHGKCYEVVATIYLRSLHDYRTALCMSAQPQKAHAGLLYFCLWHTSSQ